LRGIFRPLLHPVEDKLHASTNCDFAEDLKKVISHGAFFDQWRRARNVEAIASAPAASCSAIALLTVRGGAPAARCIIRSAGGCDEGEPAEVIREQGRRIGRRQEAGEGNGAGFSPAC
jgi:hypothetical protein